MAKATNQLTKVTAAKIADDHVRAFMRASSRTP
jgi:hypothetical protein